MEAIGVLLAVGFLGFVVWKIYSKKKSGAASGGGGGVKRPPQSEK